MKRTALWVFVVCAALLAPQSAWCRQYYGFAVGVANAPRPPQIRIAREPHALLASDAMVYVVDDPAVRFDGDLFHYGQYWFAYTRGFWYRARAPRGPYAVIDVLKVPRAIIGVPRKLWTHHPLGEAPGKAVSASSVATRSPRVHPMAKPVSVAPRATPVMKPTARAKRAAATGPTASETRRTPRGSSR